MSGLKQKNDTVRGLVAALGQVDPAETGHSERVMVYAVSTGERLGMSDEGLLALKWAAQLHDVGKIALGPELVRKLGKLSEAELDQLRSHAALSLQILSEHAWLEPALPMIVHHHERWDGKGYPYGLAGEAIPFGARIIGVAEAFDVMVSGTPWSRPFEREEALRELKSNAGLQFDPNVVEAFSEIEILIQPVYLS